MSLAPEMATVACQIRRQVADRHAAPKELVRVKFSLFIALAKRIA